MFTVKSAYHIAYHLAEKKEVVESSWGDPLKPLWKCLWQLNLPAKIKIFAWRACVNGLPTKEKLCSRGINTSFDCPNCSEELESIHHVLLHCKFASHMWNFWVDGLLLIQRNTWIFSDLALFILSHKSLQDLELFFSVAWAIWHNRNKSIYEGTCSPPV